jgi:hypothetical protein
MKPAIAVPAGIKADVSGLEGENKTRCKNILLYLNIGEW